MKFASVAISVLVALFVLGMAPIAKAQGMGAEVAPMGGTGITSPHINFVAQFPRYTNFRGVGITRAFAYQQGRLLGACKLDNPESYYPPTGKAYGAIPIKAAIDGPVISIVVFTSDELDHMRIYRGGCQLLPDEDYGKEMTVTMAYIPRNNGLPAPVLYHPSWWGLQEMYKRPDELYTTCWGDWVITSPGIICVSPSGVTGTIDSYVPLEEAGWWTFIRKDGRRYTATFCYVYYLDPALAEPEAALPAVANTTMIAWRGARGSVALADGATVERDTFVNASISGPGTTLETMDPESVYVFCPDGGQAVLDYSKWGYPLQMTGTYVFTPRMEGVAFIPATVVSVPPARTSAVLRINIVQRGTSTNAWTYRSNVTNTVIGTKAKAVQAEAMVVEGGMLAIFAYDQMGHSWFVGEGLGLPPGTTISPNKFNLGDIAGGSTRSLTFQVGNPFRITVEKWQGRGKQPVQLTADGVCNVRVGDRLRFGIARTGVPGAIPANPFGIYNNGDGQRYAPDHEGYWIVPEMGNFGVISSTIATPIAQVYLDLVATAGDPSRPWFGIKVVPDGKSALNNPQFKVTVTKNNPGCVARDVLAESHMEGSNLAVFVSDDGLGCAETVFQTGLGLGYEMAEGTGTIGIDWTDPASAKSVDVIVGMPRGVVPGR